ncbi:MAG: SDR family oxidoreductase [Reyranella sp.]|uniref:3-hydroxybutyrate dehydrogenase n=1 Tax=Reyranella sp. TaxID=1929291 RepID=UPI001228F1C7|nr:3-hydroxybutyrate dehydrogenase [Reyranella sp.]TAJ85135.1 MAG: SDR family oxidoreductase [Reyranella sp.]TBR29075.1 MAG: SDR family oxidoreductase [Reyranella sp.]
MLKGRCALITGSTQGLGYAMAERLAAEGCTIVMNGFGDAGEIEGRRRALEETHGVRALHHGADLAEPKQIADLVAAAEHTFGGVDILINNAVVRHFAPVETFQPEDWDRALAVNLSAAFHTTRLVLAGMRARGFGRILNISSVYGLFGGVNRVDYITTKTALIGFTRAVALETARDNITCNAICPGSSPTPAIEQRLEEFMDAEGLPREQAVGKFMAGRQPSGRFVAMESVAALATFLCGPGAADITGAALPVDGGWSAS